ncbi:hypothetical protein AXY43_02715 [Clostridium sp. MF28]|jgi:hypothetical protein|uniref:Uncharacterized protein n=1 Tax=Clostridium diolis TaxID=223919 RepID=A0AAV3VWJ7_9CLOT|nr:MULTISPECIES: hypothetical protein [Clostridium]AVK47016.1 hypothetical protein AXY43_02715 [Clostridium sp. MF28]PSM58249.1 hypothetical protein C4L39_08430 [Clostridium diolis]QES74046.1 hypothetical protein F3K33_14990 [Clostridium diolis]GEA30583.1 hypothetical protein CDIOL_15060 [Clostridium diolis]
MKLLKKILLIIELVVFIFTMIFSNSYKEAHAQTANQQQNSVKASVLLYRFDDAYISLVRQSLEDIPKNNEGKIEFTFYDVRDSQAIQNQMLLRLEFC